MASRLSCRWVTSLGRHACFAGALALALAGGVPACAGTQPYVWVSEVPIERLQFPMADRIGVDDLISVRVYAQEAMSTRGRVRPDGSFTLPLLGEVPVVGKRPADLSRELEEQLKQRGLVVAPSVSVAIEESAPLKVTIIGEVRRPGTVKLEPPVGVMQSLANAGGLTEFASGSRIFVVRSGNAPTDVVRIRFRYDDLIRGEPHATAFRLRSGDVVVVE